MARGTDAAAKTAERLRKRALGYPETYEESPWGDRVVKVRGKIFFFCGARDGGVSLTVKLPQSGRAVLAEKLATPTAYGLGKSGWVSATFAAGKAVPEERIAAWIDESYRALAPKKLVAQLDAVDEPAPPRAAPEKKPPKRKPSAKRVMLLCHDALRVERTVRELAARGVTVEAAGSAGDVRARLAKLDAVIVDVGRLADEGLELAAEIDASDFPILIFIAGIRDAAARKRAQAAATSADLFRAPPGDPSVADAIAATLAQH